MVIKEEFRCGSLGLNHSHPHHFVTSQWRWQQKFFLLWRIFWFLWHLGWLIRSFQLQISQSPSDPSYHAKWFIYLTNWSYLLLFVQSALHLAIVGYHTSKGETEEEHFKDGGMRWHFKIVWLLSCVAFDAAILITILYWSLVFKKLDRALSIMTHGVNTLYVLADIFAVASPVRLFHFLYSTVYATAYLIFTVIYHVEDGTNNKNEPYIYSSLDWANTGKTIGMALGVVFIALPLVHLFQFALFTFRLHLNETCCVGKTGQVGDSRSSTRSPQDVELGTVQEK